MEIKLITDGIQGLELDVQKLVFCPDDPERTFYNVVRLYRSIANSSTVNIKDVNTFLNKFKQLNFPKSFGINVEDYKPLFTSYLQRLNVNYKDCKTVHKAYYGTGCFSHCLFSLLQPEDYKFKHGKKLTGVTLKEFEFVAYKLTRLCWNGCMPCTNDFFTITCKKEYKLTTDRTIFEAKLIHIIDTLDKYQVIEKKIMPNFGHKHLRCFYSIGKNNVKNLNIFKTK
jgi:hypothetical protein